jgi:hypothetical protein
MLSFIQGLGFIPDPEIEALFNNLQQLHKYGKRGCHHYLSQGMEDLDHGGKQLGFGRWIVRDECEVYQRENVYKRSVVNRNINMGQKGNEGFG